MFTVSQFRKVFIKNGGQVSGKIIEKFLISKPNQQLFAQILKKQEVRHFMVNLLDKKNL